MWLCVKLREVKLVCVHLCICLRICVVACKCWCQPFHVCLLVHTTCVCCHVHIHVCVLQLVLPHGEHSSPFIASDLPLFLSFHPSLFSSALSFSSPPPPPVLPEAATYNQVHSGSWKKRWFLREKKGFLLCFDLAPIAVWIYCLIMCYSWI